jgi:hypothetical protein
MNLYFNNCDDYKNIELNSALTLGYKFENAYTIQNILLNNHLTYLIIPVILIEKLPKIRCYFFAT